MSFAAPEAGTLAVAWYYPPGAKAAKRALAASARFAFANTARIANSDRSWRGPAPACGNPNENNKPDPESSAIADEPYPDSAADAKPTGRAAPPPGAARPL